MRRDGYERGRTTQSDISLLKLSSLREKKMDSRRWSLSHSAKRKSQKSVFDRRFRMHSARYFKPIFVKVRRKEKRNAKRLQGLPD